MSKYAPSKLPDTEAPELANALEHELRAISDVVNVPDLLELRELNVVPERPRDGMIALADGTNWNPGSGAGFYGYYGGAWNKLG